MIVKRSGRNQVAIPKRLIREAGLGEEDVYFEIQYAEGCFVLKPLVFEDRIPAASLERFKSRTMQPEVGDRSFDSLGEAISSLKSKASRGRRKAK